MDRVSSSEKIINCRLSTTKMNSKEDDLLNLYGENVAVSNDENIVLEGELSHPNENPTDPTCRGSPI